MMFSRGRPHALSIALLEYFRNLTYCISLNCRYFKILIRFLWEIVTMMYNVKAENTVEESLSYKRIQMIFKLAERLNFIEKSQERLQIQENTTRQN